MTNKEILKKAIYKALVNGYDSNIDIYIDLDDNSTIIYEDLTIENAINRERWSVRHIIFSHEFAQCFWGRSLMISNEYYISGDGKQTVTPLEIPYWQYNLSKMVLKKEPLKYLEHFLTKEK